MAEMFKYQYELNPAGVDTNKHIKYFNPPFPRLDKIRVSFRNYFNNLYNFRGREHLLIFEIQTLHQSHKYVSDK